MKALGEDVRDSVLGCIGNTPLIRLGKVAPQGCTVYAKAEYFNPSGSLKDRIALEMIRDAEEKGLLGPGYTIVEASTGNTGTALSLVGTRLGYNVEIYMPEGMTPERRRLMEAYGARIYEIPLEHQGGGVAGAEVEVATRRRCLEEESSRSKVWWARQFSNPANTRAHVKTGREILSQIGGPVDAFVASIGVGGTLYGVAKALKEANPETLIVGLEPSSARFPISEGHYRIPGVGRELSGGIIAEMMESGIVDRVVKVTNEDAVAFHKRLVVEEGLACGVSSGANALMACKLAQELGPGSKVATVLPDHLDRYLSERRYTT